ncbi:hypothetical protein TNCV_1192571 [Trichonephila clavipes]|nr:hypothetical protein TNCV_1192571 [Trichonephila clavipes]
MIVQFRNEKVSNHGSIPITIDCNVVAFIVFEEGFHQPIQRTKQGNGTLHNLHLVAAPALPYEKLHGWQYSFLQVGHPRQVQHLQQQPSILAACSQLFFPVKSWHSFKTSSFFLGGGTFSHNDLFGC